MPLKSTGLSFSFPKWAGLTKLIAEFCALSQVELLTLKLASFRVKRGAEKIFRVQ